MVLFLFNCNNIFQHYKEVIKMFIYRNSKTEKNDEKSIPPNGCFSSCNDSRRLIQGEIENHQVKCKKMLTLLIASLLIIFSFLTPFINDSFEILPNAGPLKISTKSETIGRTQSVRIKIYGTNKKVSWQITKKAQKYISYKRLSNTCIKVKGKKAGTVNVIAKIEGKKFRCVVTVKPYMLSKKKVTINVGGSESVKLYGGGDSVKWQSSDEKIATVNPYGKRIRIRGKKAGYCTVAGRYKGRVFRVKVHVKGKSSKKKTTKRSSTKKTFINTDNAAKGYSDGVYYNKKHKLYMLVHNEKWYYHGELPWKTEHEVCLKNKYFKEFHDLVKRTEVITDGNHELAVFLAFREIALDWHYKWYDKSRTDYGNWFVMLKNKSGTCTDFATGLNTLFYFEGVDAMLIESKQLNHMKNVIKYHGKWYAFEPQGGRPISFTKDWANSSWKVINKEKAKIWGDNELSFQTPSGKYPSKKAMAATHKDDSCKFWEDFDSFSDKYTYSEKLKTWCIYISDPPFPNPHNLPPAIFENF